MSLDFDLRDIDDWKNAFPATKDGYFNHKLECIIYGCISTRIGKITIDNYIEWFNRYRTLCIIEERVPFLELKDVRKAIGLSTNVYPEASRKEWLKDIASRSINERMARWQDTAELGEAFVTIPTKEA